MEKLLKAEQVAEILNLSRTSIFRMAASGQLPSVKLPGRSIRFSLSDIEKVLQRRGLEEAAS